MNLRCPGFEDLHTVLAYSPYPIFVLSRFIGITMHDVITTSSSVRYLKLRPSSTNLPVPPTMD